LTESHGVATLVPVEPEGKPAVVAVIGSVFPIPPEAGTPRPFQLLKRLARKTEVHCLAVVPQSPEDWERFRENPSLSGCFTSSSVFYRRTEVSAFAQARTLLSGLPLFDQRYRDPTALAAARARARALARLHHPAVFYCWERDTLQYVPRDLWPGTLVDFVDAPGLATERRLASDETLRGFERLKLRMALFGLHRFERRALTSVGIASFNSTADIATLRARVPDAPIINVIDGGDTDYFTPEAVTGVAEASAELMFFGNLGYPPNGDAALHLVRDIMPLVWRARPDARVVVVGPEPPEALRRLQDGRRVAVTGFVDDVRPYLARATVVVSPLRFGTGMKNKLQAGLAMEKAMVASPVTCEGFDRLEPGVHALVADGADEAARAVLSLLDDPARRRALGKAGRELIRAHYGWDAAVDVLWANLRHLATGTDAGRVASATLSRST
jgi:glycosyltransferase involved in cell wall biosynthesis